MKNCFYEDSECDRGAISRLLKGKINLNPYCKGWGRNRQLYYNRSRTGSVFTTIKTTEISFRQPESSKTQNPLITMVFLRPENSQKISTTKTLQSISI